MKISTVVQPEELEAFFARYAEVCKGGMSGLRKRDRSRRKKEKGRKKKGGGWGGGEEGVNGERGCEGIEGPCAMAVMR